MTKLLLTCLVLVLVSACGCQARMLSANEMQLAREAPPVAAVPVAAKAAGSGVAAVPGPASPASSAEASQPLQGRRIIYTATFSVLVARVDEALENTRKMTEQFGGYVQSMRGSEIIIRVPSAKFNETTAALAGVGRILSKEVAAADVTDSYADLEVRIKAAKAVLDEFSQLLAKSANVEEALKVEREIGRVRSEIEQMEAQMIRLSSQVTYATLTINFTPVPPASVPPEFRVNLPVPWLKQLGLDSLLQVVGM
jgi:hypothetical protein